MDQLEKLKEQVFAQRPTLGKIYRQFGKVSIYNYTQQWEYLRASEYSKQFIGLLADPISAIYSGKKSKDILAELIKQPFVSTIDHHGILNHPFFINSNLIFSLRQNTKYLICLSTSGISLNNSSWPGCLLRTDAGNQLKRFSFFPDKLKTGAVMGAKAMAKDDTERVLGAVKKDKDLSAEDKSSLENLITHLFQDERVLGLPGFTAQASALSTRLWQHIFPNAPEIIYIPIEEVVRDAIIKLIVPDSNHPLHKLLFTSPGLNLVEKYFHGDMGAFNRTHKGSFLFWGLDNKGKRIKLARKNAALIGDGLTFSLEPDAILKTLIAKQLYPTSLLCFLVLLWYELTCLGGFNQVDWLTETKLQFVSLLTDFGEEEHSERVQQVPTENFAESNLAILPGLSQPIKAAAADILIAQKGYEYFYDLSQKITVGESLESLLPEIYKIVTDQAQRSPLLLNVSDQEIMKVNGMWGKIVMPFSS